MKKFCLSAGVVLLLSLAFIDQRSLKRTPPGFKLPAAQTTSGDNQMEAEQPAQPLRVLARELSPVTTSETEADANSSDEAIEQAVENIASADVPVALAALSTEAGRAAMEKRKLLIRRWAESDPVAAAQWAQQFPEGDLRNAMYEQIAAAWANSDLSGATDWLNTLPDGIGKQTATVTTANEAARTEPISALTLAVQLPATPERNALLTYAVSQWATENFSAAAEWAGTIADAGLREDMLSAIAVAAASADAPAAATLVASAFAPGVVQARTAVAITQRWVQTAPEEAAAWVVQFPDLPLRDAAVENLVGLWALSDASAAANWVNALPDGALREAATQALAANQPHPTVPATR